MISQPVHWHEGMFLRPQHFQASQRHVLDTVRQHIQWDQHYCWGLRRFRLDADALANNRFVVPELAARLRDGTLIDFPRDGSLPEKDIRSILRDRPSATMYIAVPRVEMHRASVSDNASVNGTRYRIENLQVEDENTGLNARTIQVRRLNVTALTDADDHAGYEVLPLCRIRRGDHADGIPECDIAYIPSLIACDAWPLLVERLLRPICDRIGKKIDLVGNQVVQRGISFDSVAQGDRLLIEQLQAMNESYATLGVQAFAEGVHPLDVYRTLVQFVGRMAIFTTARRVPELPRYDHDELGDCFWAMKRQIDAMLDVVVEPEYRERAFVGAGQRLQVALENAWLEPGYRLFVAVTGTLPTDQIRRLVEGRLDMKIGAGESVDELYRLGRAGLRFAFNETPPRCLPPRSGRVFFSIDPSAADDQWNSVRRTLNLAIRFNDSLLKGDIQGRNSIDLTIDQTRATLDFLLYAVPPSAL
jgi:type VI secretion system protein ImpJ